MTEHAEISESEFLELTEATRFPNCYEQRVVLDHLGDFIEVDFELAFLYGESDTDILESKIRSHLAALLRGEVELNDLNPYLGGFN